MKLKPYLALLARPNPKAFFTEAELKEVKRLLGDDVCPLMASKDTAIIAFISTDKADRTIERIQAAVGDETRISVLELGPDQAQRGLPLHNQWFSQLQWLTQPETK